MVPGRRTWLDVWAFGLFGLYDVVTCIRALYGFSACSMVKYVYTTGSVRFMCLGTPMPSFVLAQYGEAHE